MLKKKISAKQKKSLNPTPKLKIKKNTGVVAYSPTERLLDEDLISRAIWECLKKNDPHGVMEILETYVEALNKKQLAQKAAFSRSTLYHIIREKNPTLSTLAKLVHACA